MTGPKLSGCMALFLFLVEYTAANCALKLDLVFIIDGTSAVPPHDFSKLKQAVLALLRCMHERDQVHAGVIVYGSTLARPIPLSGDRNKLVELEGVKPPMGQPETHIALLNGRALFRKRGRPHVRKVVVFLTSGLGKFVHETIQQAAHAREEGYRLFVVTLADDVKGVNQLPWRPGDIFKLKNVNEMVEELGKIARKICSVAHAEDVKPLVNPSGVTPTTGQPNKAREDIAKLLRGKANVEAIDVCSNSVMVEGVGYARHSKECEKFVQCFLKGRTWYHVVQSCGLGEFWDHTLLACRIAEVVDCPNDRCKDPTVTSVPHSDNCRAYYKCEKGRSVGQCCPNGLAFEPERGCVNYTACSQECPPEVIPKRGSCDRAAVFARPEVYSQYVSAGSFWVEMLCANGSWYNDRKCECSNKIVKPWDNDIDSRDSICKPEVYLPFCGGLMDQSGNGNAIENEGDRVFVIDGKAYFNGHSTLYLPSFSNAHYGDSIVIKLKYKMVNRTPEDGHSEEYNDFDYYSSNDDSYDFNDEFDEDEDDRLYNTMALVSNGDCDNDYTWSGSCYENPTITVATNRRTTIFNVHTSEDEHETQMELHKKVEKKSHDELDYYDDEYYSYLFENEFHDDTNNCTNDTWDDEWRTVMFLVHNNTFNVYDNNLHDQSPVAGFVKTTSAGLQFGQGSGFRNFKGYMDEIYVYLCRPDNDVLFDNVDNSRSGSTLSEFNIDDTTQQTFVDVTTYVGSPTTSIETTEAETYYDVSDYSSVDSVKTKSAGKEHDKSYLTRIITEALDSDFTSTVESTDFSEVTSFSESITSFKASFTTVPNPDATLRRSASTLNPTSSSIIESSSSSSVTKTSPDSFNSSPLMFMDTTQPLIDSTETSTEKSSISLQTSYQTTFEQGVKEHTAENEDWKTIHNVTSVTEKSDSNNNEYNSSSEPHFVGIVENITLPVTSLRDILLKNNSFLSLTKKTNIDINSKQLATSLKLGNDTLQLQNSSEKIGNHCCIDSYMNGATKMHNHTAQSVHKTNGATTYNENGILDRNDSLTTAVQNIDDPAPTESFSSGMAATQSVKFSKEHIANYDSNDSDDSGQPGKQNNATEWRAEH